MGPLHDVKSRFDVFVLSYISAHLYFIKQKKACLLLILFQAASCLPNCRSTLSRKMKMRTWSIFWSSEQYVQFSTFVHPPVLSIVYN